jgi:hypothetical protein
MAHQKTHKNDQSFCKNCFENEWKICIQILGNSHLPLSEKFISETFNDGGNLLTYCQNL